MSLGLIGKTAGRLLLPFIFIFGFYTIVHGHLTPGGGFQGGAVIASGTALIFVCYYYREAVENSKFISLKNLKLVEAAGLILFICTALAGIVMASGFLVNWANAGGLIFGHAVALGANAGDILTAGIIPVLNFAIGIEVFGALSVVILCMMAGLREPTSEQDKMEEMK